MSERVMSEATEAGARVAEMEQEITTGDLLAALADLGRRVNALADQLEGADRRLTNLEQMAVTVQHAAGLTSLRVTDLRLAIADGDLPACQVGRRVVVLTTALREWVEGHKLAPIGREAS